MRRAHRLQICARGATKFFCTAKPKLRDGRGQQEGQPRISLTPIRAACSHFCPGVAGTSQHRQMTALRKSLHGNGKRNQTANRLVRRRPVPVEARCHCISAAKPRFGHVTNARPIARRAAITRTAHYLDTCIRPRCSGNHIIHLAGLACLGDKPSLRVLSCSHGIAAATS